MATQADQHADLGAATDRLLEACAAAASIRFDPDPAFDALAIGVRAVAGAYERAAAAPRRKSRRKP